MSKYVLLLIISFFVFIPLFTKPAFAFSGSGNGSSGNPYQITTCAQLHEIANNLSANYLMKNDVDCNGFSFAPIGDTTSNFFVGKLDGGGHKITNLNINSNENGVGIFEELGTGGVITNIGYESGSLTQQGDTAEMGSFAAIVSGGSITNSYSKASIDGSTVNFISPVIGGLLGHGDTATVSNSYYSGNIINGTMNANYTAGIAGYLSAGSITNSYSAGTITNGQYVGGIAGRMFSSATITNAFSTMTFTNVSLVGGLVGQISSGSITNGYYNDPIGGFFGMQCYSGGSTGCTTITKNIPYFYTVTNHPMDSWDFVNTWSMVNDGTAYPLLNWQSPNPTPTPTPTATPSPTTVPVSHAAAPQTPAKYVCVDSAPNGTPNLFQIDSSATKAKLYFAPVTDNTNKYYISFGYTSGDMRFGGELAGNSTGVLAYTISSLSPNTTYYIRVRAGNGCATGGWSNELKIVTAKKGSSSGKAFYKDYGARVISNIIHQM